MSVVDSFRLESHRTKPFAEALGRLGFRRGVLLVDSQENPNLWMASRNLPEVQVLRNLQVTPYHVFNARHLVFTKDSILALQEVLK